MSTNSVRAKDIKREWQLVDAKNKIVGRIATEIATMLMGKNKPNYVPYLDMGDNVVVINAAKVKFSGKKESQKRYYTHSGYPGGLKTKTVTDIRTDKPEQLVSHAVWGMMPKGTLGRQMIKKLHVYGGSEHPYKKQMQKVEGEEKNG